MYVQYNVRLLYHWAWYLQVSHSVHHLSSQLDVMKHMDTDTDTQIHIWRWNNKYGSQPAQIIISLLPNYGGRRIAVIDGNVAVMFADLKATHSIVIAFLFLFLDK